MWDTTFHVIILAVMLFGLLGLLIPILPGLIIIWVAALAYGLVEHFTWQSGVIFAGMTLIMLVGNVIDNFIMGASARKEGAPWIAIGLAMILGIAGSIILPPFGGLVAALLGLFVYEFIRLKDWRKAFQSTKGMALGCGWSAVVRAGMGALMICLWIVWARFF
jgi:uncharacterized protein YqgC (DUF456 family)